MTFEQLVAIARSTSSCVTYDFLRSLEANSLSWALNVDQHIRLYPETCELYTGDIDALNAQIAYLTSLN